MAVTTTHTDKEQEEENKKIYRHIDDLANKSHIALSKMDDFTQEQVDHLCQVIENVGVEHAEELAKLAVEETGRGKVIDKTAKNEYASRTIWETMKDMKTVGVVERDEKAGIVKIAEPIGVIAGVTPVTNPTSTVIFKAMIAMKSKNTIIFGFHPQAQKSCVKTAELIRDATVAAGAPEDWIQWITEPSLTATTALMNNPKVQMVLATGGPGMVKAAYSTGKPALGVGPGNGPSYIEKTADLDQSVNDIVLSKTFDNGMICASENSVVVDADVYDEVKQKFAEKKCYFLSKDETKKFEEHFIDPRRGTVAGPMAGKSAYQIAKMCGVDVPEDTTVVIAEYHGVGKGHPLSAEKLSPVLTMYKAKDQSEAFTICTALLNYGGRGHTAGIHTHDVNVLKKFAFKMSACRILVNSPAALGGIGGIYNNLMPSLTLGTGSYGSNSVSHNITAMDLLNIKYVAYRRDEKHRF